MSRAEASDDDSEQAERSEGCLRSRGYQPREAGVLACVRACGRAGVRACGRAGVRACGRAGVRACGPEAGSEAGLVKSTRFETVRSPAEIRHCADTAQHC